MSTSTRKLSDRALDALDAIDRVATIAVFVVFFVNFFVILAFGTDGSIDQSNPLYCVSYALIVLFVLAIATAAVSRILQLLILSMRRTRYTAILKSNAEGVARKGRS